MANPDSVGQLNLDSFGYGMVAQIRATALNTAGNAVVTLPLLRGGLTNSGNSTTSGSVIIRRITVQNPSGSISTANVSITTSSDGNTSNAVVANVALSTVSAVNRFQDLTIAGVYGANTAVSGNVTSALFVNVNTASGNANTVDICVFGQVVGF
jgi:hypothetical protein